MEANIFRNERDTESRLTRRRLRLAIGRLYVALTISLFLTACAQVQERQKPIATESRPVPVVAAAASAAAPVAAPLAMPVQILGKLVTVWYGTNRKVVSKPTEMNWYANDRDDRMHFGTVSIMIPRSHRFGSMGSSWRFRFTGEDEPLSISQLREASSEDSFWKNVREQLSNTAKDERRVLLFVHGYNSSFFDAALRTAQIWADLELKGIPVFFSWPSEDQKLHYTVDESSIDASERYLTAFLQSLAAQSGATRIDVIAHSMGNRALLRVVSQAANAAAKTHRVKLGQVFLAAPDVDLEVFQYLARAYPLLADRTTLYVSRTDKAILLSKGLHKYERTGGPPPFAQVPNVETVEVKVPSQGLLELGHSFFAEFRPVMEDIRSLITTGMPSSLRTSGIIGHGPEAPDFVLGN